MKTIFCWCLLVGLVTPARLLGDDGGLSGVWAGGYERGSDYVFLQLRFKANEGRLSGTYDAPLLFQAGRSVRQLSLQSRKVSFEMPTLPGSPRFTGEFMKDGILSGHVRNGTNQQPCRFTRLAAINPQQYRGLYTKDSGRFVSIRTGVELGLNAIQFVDFNTARIGALFPVTTSEFFTGPAVLVPNPTEATVNFTFDEQGRATRFTWSGTEVFRAKRVDLQQQEITFSNGAVSLAGELILPNTPGPHPVIVFAAGGSTYGTREMFRVYAEFFATHEIAGLIYDKRGLGASTGDWLRAGFEDLATDTLAGVRMLKSRRDIDPRRIGLMGASQSGWIVALAASQSKDVAFIISQSGPGVGVEEQELYRSEAWLRADGFSDEDIRDAMKFIRQRYQCAITGDGWEDLLEAQREAKNKSWFAYSRGEVGKDHAFWDFWRLVRTYDPAPSIEKVTCPVLAVFGAKDTFLPVEKSARIWRAALDKGGNKDVTIHVFPDGDHSLIECNTGGLKEVARARRFVPGYFETLRDWTLKRVK